MDGKLPKLFCIYRKIIQFLLKSERKTGIIVKTASAVSLPKSNSRRYSHRDERSNPLRRNGLSRSGRYIADLWDVRRFSGSAGWRYANVLRHRHPFPFADSAPGRARTTTTAPGRRCDRRRSGTELKTTGNKPGRSQLSTEKEKL